MIPGNGFCDRVLRTGRYLVEKRGYKTASTNDHKRSLFFDLWVRTYVVVST